MTATNGLIPEQIAKWIHLVRGQKVMLDADLAVLYKVETRTLVQAVKRNLRRFPHDFMFQLTHEEWAALRSQLVISSGRGGRRYAPYVFTEHGALMLSSVLSSDTAADVGLVVVRTFVQLREMLSTHKELAAKLEALDRKVGGHDQAIADLIDAIRQLMAPPVVAKRPIGFVQPKGKPGK
ncbi:MAG: ORF6N domain-containing protein [Zoogloeaceae bacterium]|nr:ORF6N domain-containing protein [Zoogloeaceae bacterium]